MRSSVTRFSGKLGRPGVMVGSDGLKDLFQPSWFMTMKTPASNRQPFLSVTRIKQHQHWEDNEMWCTSLEEVDLLQTNADSSEGTRVLCNTQFRSLLLLNITYQIQPSSLAQNPSSQSPKQVSSARCRARHYSLTTSCLEQHSRQAHWNVPGLTLGRAVPAQEREAEGKLLLLNHLT